MIKRIFIVFVLIAVCPFTGCSGSHLVVKNNNGPELCGCLPLPDCVSSNSLLFYNKVEPFRLAVSEEKAWAAVREEVVKLPRTTIVEERPYYIHAKCRSLVFRFVDNLELLLDPDKKVISVRSGAVIGITDFGVNYWRIRTLRKDLSEKGIIK
jgi:uncharacterized protein (DUF1499 family)